MREPHQLVHHGVASTLRQFVHVGGRQAGGGDRGEHCGSISKPVLVTFIREVMLLTFSVALLKRAVERRGRDGARAGDRDRARDRGRARDSGTRQEAKLPLTANIDNPGPEYPRLDVEDMRVVGHNNGDDGHLRLDREVERAFLERQQVRRPRVRPRALGEDEDALLLAPHVCGRAVEGGARGGAVRAVDEDGFGEGHWEGGLASLVTR